MYEMSQRHPVWVAENHVKPCNSVGDVQLVEAVKPIRGAKLYEAAS